MRANVWSVMLTMNVVLLVLLAMAFPTLEPGSGSWTMAVASLVLILATMAGTVAVLRSGWRPFDA
jgi:hypothetical protein